MCNMFHVEHRHIKRVKVSLSTMTASLKPVIMTPEALSDLIESIRDSDDRAVESVLIMHLERIITLSELAGGAIREEDRARLRAQAENAKWEARQTLRNAFAGYRKLLRDRGV